MLQNETEKIQQIVKAIASKKPLEFRYKGKVESRQVNCHNLYTNRKQVNCLDAVQTKGETSSENDKFKIFILSDMDYVVCMSWAESFVIDSQYNAESIRYVNSTQGIKE